MSNVNIQELLDRYLSGDCSAEEQIKVEKWLEQQEGGDNRWTEMDAPAKAAWMALLYQDVQRTIKGNAAAASNVAAGDNPVAGNSVAAESPVIGHNPAADDNAAPRGPHVPPSLLPYRCRRGHYPYHRYRSAVVHARVLPRPGKDRQYTRACK